MSAEMKLIKEDMKKTDSVILLLLLLVLTSAIPAWAASDWVEYSRDEDGNVYWYKTVKGSPKQIVQVWDQKTFSKEGRRKHLEEMTKNGFSTAGYEKLALVKVLVEFDCKKKMSKGISVNMFDSGNRALYSMYYDKPEWTYMQDDSLWEKLRKEVCR